MAEYIEREAVLKIIGDNCPPDKCGYNTEEEMGAGAACYYIGKDVEKIPTADVVPKSEVEELKAIIADHKASEERLEELYSNAKAEVAREIFEEISKASVDWGCYCVTLSKGAFLAEDVNRTLAELKKKYTEVNDGTRREI